MVLRIGMTGGGACAAKRVQWTLFSPERPRTPARAGPLMQQPPYTLSPHRYAGEQI
jgi:hypothetical protein